MFDVISYWATFTAIAVFVFWWVIPLFAFTAEHFVKEVTGDEYRASRLGRSIFELDRGDYTVFFNKFSIHCIVTAFAGCIFNAGVHLALLVYYFSNDITYQEMISAMANASQDYVGIVTILFVLYHVAILIAKKFYKLALTVSSIKEKVDKL